MGLQQTQTWSAVLENLSKFKKWELTATKLDERGYK